MTAAPKALEAALSEAVAKAAAVDTQKADLTARRLGHEFEARQARELAASIWRAAAEEDSDRVLSGEKISGRAEADAVAAERSAEAHDGSACKLGVAIVGLGEEEVAARLHLTGAALDFTLAGQDAAKAGVMQTVSNLIGPLAAMIAAEDVRTQLIGSKFTFDAARNPPATLWSGRHLASAVIDGLPARVTPDGFRDEVIAVAGRITRETLQQIGAHE